MSLWSACCRCCFPRTPQRPAAAPLLVEAVRPGDPPEPAAGPVVEPLTPQAVAAAHAALQEGDGGLTPEQRQDAVDRLFVQASADGALTAPLFMEEVAHRWAQRHEVATTMARVSRLFTSQAPGLSLRPDGLPAARLLWRALPIFFREGMEVRDRKMAVALERVDARMMGEVSRWLKEDRPFRGDPAALAVPVAELDAGLRAWLRGTATVSHWAGYLDHWRWMETTLKQQLPLQASQLPQAGPGTEAQEDNRRHLLAVCAQVPGFRGGMMDGQPCGMPLESVFDLKSAQQLRAERPYRPKAVATEVAGSGFLIADVAGIVGEYVGPWVDDLEAPPPFVCEWRLD